MPLRRTAEEKETRKEEKEREKAEKHVQKEREAEERLRAAEKAAFDASPPGQARLAKKAGQRFFQTVIPIENVDRTLLAKFSHEMQTRVKDTSDVVGALLTAIEAEGWELFQAGYVFRETGGASRDKFLASGQQIAVMGDTLGIYLFRSRD
jgi:hypothetical protein